VGPSAHLPNWTAITKRAKDDVNRTCFDTLTVVDWKIASKSYTLPTRIFEQVLDGRQPVFVETHDLTEVPQLALAGFRSH
jgi:hypothetical protein